MIAFHALFRTVTLAKMDPIALLALRTHTLTYQIVIIYIKIALNGCVYCTYPNCITCIDGPTCTDCQPGYYLNTSVLRMSLLM